MFLMRARLASNPYPKAFFVFTSVYFTLMMREHLSAPTFTLAISNLTEVFCAAQAIFFADSTFPLPRTFVTLPKQIIPRAYVPNRGRRSAYKPTGGSSQYR